MRRFDYRKDQGIISNTIKGYLSQLESNLKELYTMYHNELFLKALKVLETFNQKYPDLKQVENEILKDLLTNENVSYCFEHKKYPPNASSIGESLNQDLKKITDMESDLRDYLVKHWCDELTSYNQIQNGKEFRVVGHAASILPGLADTNDYIESEYRNQYLSCSVISNNELNTFQGKKIVYVVLVDNDNYLFASDEDAVTRESSYPDFQTIATIIINGKERHIKAGYSNDSKTSVITAATPRLIEKKSIEREVKTEGEILKYEGCITNEVGLNRSKTRMQGALLISNGCDLLLYEYLVLKHYHIPFKCINKGLYRLQNNMTPYTLKEFEQFQKEIEYLDNFIKQNNISDDNIQNYYNEVVLPMHYSSDIQEILDNVLSKYIRSTDEKGIK